MKKCQYSQRVIIYLTDYISPVYFLFPLGTMVSCKEGSAMRYEQQAANLILAAGRCARGMGHSCVDSVHLLVALSEEPGRLGLAMRGVGAEPELLRQLTAGHLLSVLLTTTPIVLLSMPLILATTVFSVKEIDGK